MRVERRKLLTRAALVASVTAAVALAAVLGTPAPRVLADPVKKTPTITPTETITPDYSATGTAVYLGTAMAATETSIWMATDWANQTATALSVTGTYTATPTRTPSPYVTVTPSSTVSIPTAPLLEYPLNGSVLTTDDVVTLTWNPTTWESSLFHVQVAANSTFNRNTLVIDDTTPSLNYRAVGLRKGSYFWRVQASNIYGQAGPWSEVWMFKLVAP